MDLTIKVKFYEVPERNMETLFLTLIWQSYLARESSNNKNNNNKWDNTILENTVNMNKRVTDWEKIFTRVTDKELLSRREKCFTTQ